MTGISIMVYAPGFCFMVARAELTRTWAVRAGLLIVMLNSKSWLWVVPLTPLRVMWTP